MSQSLSSPPATVSRAEKIRAHIQVIAGLVLLTTCGGFWLKNPPTGPGTTLVLGTLTVVAVGAVAWGLALRKHGQRWKLSLGAMGAAAALVTGWIAAPVAGVGGQAPPQPTTTKAVPSDSDVPTVDSTVVGDPFRADIYAVDRTAEQVEADSSGIPPVGDDCGSQARHDWVRDSVQGVPLKWQHVDGIIGTRKTTTVALVDIQIHAKRLPTAYVTGVVLCPEDLGAGGNVYTRYVGIELRDGTRSVVTLFDLDAPEQKKELKELTLAVEEDDIVRLNLSARVEQPGIGYEWFATATVVSGGKQELVRLPSTGAFRVGNLPEAPVLWSDNESPHICGPDTPHDGSNNYWC